MRPKPELRFEKLGGLIPAIIQDAKTHRVLMLGFQNEDAYTRTRESREVWFWSRSRSRLWKKGEQSGNVLRVIETQIDCDADTILYLVEPAGSTCHRGTESCFDESDADIASEENFTLRKLEKIISDRKELSSDESYTAKLVEDEGYNLGKIREEAGEVIQSIEKNEGDSALIWESADLIYHLMVLLAGRGFSLADVERELEGRHGEHKS
jgi:phosphoribosyl-AMP cyclohydrolase / phosphoribosyl-ATP pyrophosphohydrolase